MLTGARTNNPAPSNDCVGGVAVLFVVGVVRRHYLPAGRCQRQQHRFFPSKQSSGSCVCACAVVRVRVRVCACARSRIVAPIGASARSPPQTRSVQQPAGGGVCAAHKHLAAVYSSGV